MMPLARLAHEATISGSSVFSRAFAGTPLV